MHFELLNEAHVTPLLEFELQNKAFFEKFIAPRDNSFYSVSGIRNHVNALVQDQNSRSFVLIEGESLIARANIKNIKRNDSAEIGYRVNQIYIGAGIASKCVAYLINHARHLKIKKLAAYVMNNNFASEKVLVKNNFQLALCLPNEFNHRGRNLHGFKYLHILE